jgi:short-subunit dehydrogenase
VAPISRTIVITGASSGIGKALALHYAGDRSTLGLIGRNQERLSQVAAACRELGATVQIGAIDVRSRTEVQRWLQDFDSNAAVDILIAGAGVMAGRTRDGDVEPSSAAYELMETNVLGVLNAVQPMIPLMLTRGYGQIGILSSLAAFIPLPDAPSYCGSKAAVLNYGLALRGALRRSGIGVSVICPGYVETPMMAQETGSKPFALTTERTAAIITRGLHRNRPVIAFPAMFALVTRLGGLLPEAVRRWTTPRFTVTPRTGTDA